MCLTAYVGSRKIAERDITVYKAVFVDKKHPNAWRGIYYSELEYPFDKVINLGGDNETNMSSQKRYGKLSVGKNFLHTTICIDNANWIAQCNRTKQLPVLESFMKHRFANLNGVVCMATIPKGAVYYVEDSCYASDKLIVHKPKNL